MSRESKNLLVCLVAASLILIAFFLRVNNLSQYPNGISSDEAVNALDAFFISQGAYFPVYEDRGRPEPNYIRILSVTTRFFGTSIFASRMTSVFIGTLTIAVLFWSISQIIRGFPFDTRLVVVVVGVAALVVSVGHVTLSRALYRALPQPIFMLLFIGFTSRAVTERKWRDFFLAGVSLSGTVYFYTAGLLLPSVLAPIALYLLVFQWRQIKVYVPYFVFLVLVVTIFTLPVGLRLLTQPEAALSRSGDVSSTSLPSLSKMVDSLWTHLVIRGDPNPQYNSSSSPLIPPFLSPLFVLGLIYSLFRINKVSSIIVLSFFVMSAIPAVITDEPIHGLRIIGEYAVFPLFVALGTVALYVLTTYFFRYTRYLALVILLFFIPFLSSWSLEQYRSHWSSDDVTFIYDRSIPVNSWFFRSDKQLVANYLSTCCESILIPNSLLFSLTTRSYLTNNYATVTFPTDITSLPPNTQLFIPWTLELNDIERTNRIYAVLHQGQINILPPLSQQSHQELLSNIDAAQAVSGDEVFDFIGRTRTLPDNLTLEFESITQSSNQDQPLAIYGDDDLAIISWRGPDTLPTQSQLDTVTYFIDWQALKSLKHHHSAFLQLQTQNYDSLANSDQMLYRWLYPTTLWQTDQIIPTEYTLNIPKNLQPGAYRLVVGVYYIWDGLSARSAIGDTVDNMATIGWVKVPQQSEPQIPDRSIPINATFADTFQLQASDLIRLSDTQIQLSLYWQSLVERPDIDATIFVHIADEENPVLVQQDARPWNGQYPTFIWESEETIRTEHILDIPLETSDIATLQIFTGMYTFPDLVRLMAMRNENPVEDNRVFLGTIANLLITDDQTK